MRRCRQIARGGCGVERDCACFSVHGMPKMPGTALQYWREKIVQCRLQEQKKRGRRCARDEQSRAAVAALSVIVHVFCAADLRFQCRA